MICGLGGVSPGLSGSVMLVIFGLYNKTIESIGTFFKKPKEKFLYLFPIFLGIGIGILIFGKIVSILLDRYEMITRLTFLGFIIGTIPLFYHKVKLKNFNNKYYLIIISAFLAGLSLMMLNLKFTITDSLGLFGSIFIGLVIATSTVIPGLDSAVLLSSMGLYEIYINAIASINLYILIPAVFGLGIGVLIFSSIINYLIKNNYTITYSIIFGLFLSIIPSVLNSSVKFAFNFTTLISIIFFVFGYLISFRLSKISIEEK
ncbi:MAG: DUF368 domain-containing protein [Bacilli bacterium]|nr:DUF368 domain-containing protein [Bacilli bacterium]